MAHAHTLQVPTCNCFGSKQVIKQYWGHVDFITCLLITACLQMSLTCKLYKTPVTACPHLTVCSSFLLAVLLTARGLQISTPKPAPSPDEAEEAKDTDRTDGEALGCTGSGHRLVPDGQKLHVSGELLILAVGNGRQAGGGMRLCPYAGQLLCNAFTKSGCMWNDRQYLLVTTPMMRVKWQ